MASSPPGKVLIDCDPGHDDAIALLLALKHLDVAGVTTVAGNQSLDKVTANALRVLALAGVSDIPVAAGSALPLRARPEYAAAVHGESGLDGADLPPALQEVDGRSGVDLLIGAVAEGEVDTVVATGPLTNLAAAFAENGDLPSKLTRISLMGGAFGPGNVTPSAEFNIHFDPEAAAAVFASRAPIMMSGLNLTRQASAGDPEIEQFRRLGNRAGTVVAGLVEYYRDRVRELQGRDAVPLHDACAVAALIDPALIEFEPMHVTVELAGDHTRGMTVCDGRFVGLARPQSAPEPNALVGMSIDRDRFFELLYETIASI